MKPVIIFGAGTIARLAWHYFEEKEPHSVSAFCVDDLHFSEEQFCDRPVIRASQLHALWPPGSCRMFIALGYQELNRIRRDVFRKYRDLGYEMTSCISPLAITRGASMGSNCFIMEGAILQPFSTIGDNCVCWSGCLVAHESHVEDHCFLAAHSVVGGMSQIGECTFLGMHATVRDAITVGKNCLVGAGGLVLENLPDDSLVAERATPVSPFPVSQALRFIGI